VLDTVHVTATRIAQMERAEFSKRARMGAGKFLTADDVMHRGGIYATDVLRTVAGLRIGYALDTLINDFTTYVADSVGMKNEKRILMRGIGGAWCTPVIFLNGVFLRDLEAEEVDAWIQPKEILGIEVYFEAEMPAQFQLGPRGCGAIVIWKKER
jgi:hypothetical protein